MGRRQEAVSQEERRETENDKVTRRHRRERGDLEKYRSDATSDIQDTSQLCMRSKYHHRTTTPTAIAALLAPVAR